MRGPAGLQTGLAGSINVEILEFMGVRNVAADAPGGLATVSIEQVLRWDPEVSVNCEVTLEVPGPTTVVAVITNASARSLGIAKGSTTTALFKASSVLLARRR